MAMRKNKRLLVRGVDSAGQVVHGQFFYIFRNRFKGVPVGENLIICDDDKSVNAKLVQPDPILD